MFSRLQIKTWVHWGTLSNIFSPNGHVTLYDCARRLHYRSATREIRYGLVIEEYAAKLRSLPISELVIDVADTKTVGKNADSGVAAICYAYALVKGADPQKINFNYKVLRKQLVVALENSSFDTFTICLDGTPKSHRGPLITTITSNHWGTVIRHFTVTEQGNFDCVEWPTV